MAGFVILARRGMLAGRTVSRLQQFCRSIGDGMGILGDEDGVRGMRSFKEAL